MAAIILAISSFCDNSLQCKIEIIQCVNKSHSHEYLENKMWTCVSNYVNEYNRK